MAWRTKENRVVNSKSELTVIDRKIQLSIATEDRNEHPKGTKIIELKEKSNSKDKAI